MRHGEAGRHARDSLRALTPAGRAASERVARAIPTGWRPRVIWYSPLTRAQQTAAIVANGFGVQPEQREFLTPEDSPHRLIEVLQGYSGADPLLLVSHMPLVGVLTGILTGEGEGSYFLATSDALCLEMEVAAAGCAELRRSVTATDFNY